MSKVDLLDLTALVSFDRTELEAAIRARTQAVYLGDGVVLARILGRYKIFLDPEDRGLAPHLLLDGYWECWLTRFLASWLTPGLNVVDVGANCGYYSVLMSDLVGAEGRCICVEPNPAVAELLSSSLVVNGFGSWATVECCAAGAGGSSADARLFVPHHDPKNATVWGPAEPDPDRGKTIAVPSKSLDAICHDLDRVDFIKVDAEGAEPEIFQGMSGIIDRDRPDIILEFNYAKYADSDRFIRAMADRYPRLRYLDEDSEVQAVTVEELRTQNVGVDWLLFLSDAPDTDD